jgi:O-antigen ligase
MGPFGFSTIYGQQPHNVYLEIFLVAGWAGGMAYIVLVIATLFVGLRSALVRTPWQSFVIVTIAAFVGEVAEGFIVDTDHWRHYFLLLGMVWGLTAATLKYQQQPR